MRRLFLLFVLCSPVLADEHDHFNRLLLIRKNMTQQELNSVQNFSIGGVNRKNFFVQFLTCPNTDYYQVLFPTCTKQQNTALNNYIEDGKIIRLGVLHYNGQILESYEQFTPEPRDLNIAWDTRRSTP